MPDLNEQQLRFLSKYMKVVSKKGLFNSKTNREKAIDFNDLLKVKYLEYEAAKKTADRLIEEVKKELDQLKQILGAVTKHQGGEPLAKFREDLATRFEQLDTKSKEISTEHVRVVNAPEKKPVFGEGVLNLNKLIQNLYWLKNNMPKPPALLNDGVIGALYSQRAKIAPLEVFADNKFLTDELVAVELTDPQAEKIRSDAVDAHDGLCVAAYNAICDLIDPVLQGSSTLTAEQGATATDKILSDLLSARKEPIRKLIDVIKAAAVGQMGNLVADGNPVAEREQKRSDEIAEKVKKLEKQLEGLKATIKKLGEDQKTAGSFNEKQAITKQYQDAQARMKSMSDYIDQLGAYDDNLALRVERITRGEDAVARGQSLAADPDGYIQAAGVNLAPMDEKNAMVLLFGDTDSKGKKINGVYDNLLDQFTRASTRVSADVKLFPGEADLTDISKDQFETLKSMLTAGQEMGKAADALIAGAKKANKKDVAGMVNQAQALFAKANFMFDEARNLYQVFNASNKFPLPDAPEIPDSDKDRIGKLLKASMVELDRFWGIGGDADDAIRGMLKVAGDAYEQVLNGPIPHDYANTEALINRFTKALESARKSFRPSPQDQEAKENAAKARDAVVEKLLKLYSTKEISESQIGNVLPDHLLVIERNGKKEYHEIQTKGNGKEINQRDNKDVPRESITLLLEQATMLELLAKSDAPDSAKAIELAIEESNKKLEGIGNGTENFKYIKKQIEACEELLKKSTLKEWIPANLQSTKVNFETFKTDYPTKYIIFDGGKLDGKVMVDAFHSSITTLIKDSDKVRIAYTEADKIMVQVEKDFNNSKGADKNNLTTKLAEIIKAGPKALMKDYVSAPSETAEINQLLAQMGKSLKEITDISKKASADGPLKPRVKSARTSIETKSANGIAEGKKVAETIRDEMTIELEKLNKPVGLQYLKDLAEFLKGQAAAATESKKSLEDMGTQKELVKAELKKANDILSTKNKKTFKSYKEYKTIYDSLDRQYDIAKKGYDKDKDVKNALSEYKNILPNAQQLAKDLTRLNVIWTPKQKIVNFANHQKSLDDKILSVREAAINASLKAIAEAADDPQDVIDATAKAAKTLAIAGAAEIANLVKFNVGLQVEADKAINTEIEEERRKLLAAVREKALAEVRRIRALTEKHPALKIYRDNPFVKDVSWPGFAVSLHELDVQILTTLQPQ